MALGEIVFYLSIAGIVTVILFKMFGPSKEDLEREQQMKERLADPYLYDPESGVKFTLEQAEKGTLIRNDNFQRIRTQKELNTYFDDEEKIVEEISNSLKSQNFRWLKLNEHQIQILEKTQILSNYDSWVYKNAFKISEADIVFFPQVQIESKGKGSFPFHGYQIMFWLKISRPSGHYFFREKETIEKIFDLVRNDDEFKFGKFEVFTIKRSKSIIQTLYTLKAFEKFENVEIEIHNENLFIKTTNGPSLSEFEKMFEKIKNVC